MATSNIHIIGVGYKPMPILNALRSDLPSDRIHLLWNQSPEIVDSKNYIVRALLENGFREEDVICNEVDVFDYQKILDLIMLITQIEKRRCAESDLKVHFYFNITHGTRLVTGALCTAAMIVGAQMYYLREKGDSEELGINDLLMRIPVPRIPDLDKLTEKRRRFLKMVCSEEEGMTVSRLAEEFSSKQNVNQFVGFFETNNLVERVHHGKNVRIKATELGRMAANWLI